MKMREGVPFRENRCQWSVAGCQREDARAKALARSAIPAGTPDVQNEPTQHSGRRAACVLGFFVLSREAGLDCRGFGVN
jgi:hypothetical protein